MRNLSKKIKDLRLSLGMKQGDFAKAVGDVDQSTVSKWENDMQKPAASQMVRIASLANITAEQFLGIKLPGAPSTIEGRTVRVTGELQAGSWSEAIDWPEEDQYEVPAPLPQQWADFPVHARLVSGPSMNRVYPDGTVVYIVPLQALGRKPLNGERVAVQRVDEAGNYEATLKEYVVDEQNKVWLWPRSYDPQHQAPLPYVDGRRRGGNVTIIGVVVASFVIETARP